MDTRNKLCEVLPGFLQTGPAPVCLGGQPAYSEGLIVKFHTSDGNFWIGNLQKGGIGTDAVIEFPNIHKVYIFTRGDLYIIDPDQQDPIKHSQSGYFDRIIDGPNGKIVTSNLCNIVVIEPDGTMWESERISWDGFDKMHIEKNTVRGLAYDPMDERNSWKPFTFDLETKKITGATYDMSKFEPLD